MPCVCQHEKLDICLVMRLLCSWYEYSMLLVNTQYIIGKHIKCIGCKYEVYCW